MSTLTDLIRRAKLKDPQLGADLEREFKIVSSRRAFGLNFERHRPEAVELPQRPLRKGDKVRVLPERGSTKRGDQRLWRVIGFAGAGADRMAKLSLVNGEPPESQDVAVADCVVVAEFRDVIYPGLVSTGSVERGGDKPCHTVINGENFHVLEALTYTHKGKVDCIYIDPPYNTGAKDWKYNNDYVEADDLYRHSKWLAFMERRLTVASQLLNPSDSVLIVTIDEKEVHRLGLLLQQVFPGRRAQLVTIVINPLGQERQQELARVEEFAFFVFLGDAKPAPLADDLLNAPKSEQKTARSNKVRWEWLLRGGADATRQNNPDLFFPIFVDPSARKIVSVGDPLPRDADRQSVQPPRNTVAVWPLRESGHEGRWRCSPKYFRELLAAGYARLGDYDRRRDQWAVLYLGKAQIRRIESGQIEKLGTADDGSVLLGSAPDQQLLLSPKTVWNRGAHRAGEFGTSILRALIPGRAFPYPKSLYAVEDALRVAVGDKPDAVVLDFFAGSGTTAHAAMRLNQQDGGSRQCISVTNNEVSSDELARLRKKGLRPGDPDWEQYGICDYITKPRIQAAITGTTPDGEPIKGDYKFTDELPMRDGFEENAKFFTLSYEAPVSVGHNKSFPRIAPMLWLRAGAEGRRIDTLPKLGWDVADVYGVLVDLDTANAFCNAVKNAENVRLAFIVTDDERRYQSVIRRLPSHVETVRLYESYLSNFRINLSE